MEQLMQQTGDKAFILWMKLPRRLDEGVALENPAPKNDRYRWTNIRFEKSFSRDLLFAAKQKGKASGCIAVSGRLEVASKPGCLQLI